MMDELQPGDEPYADDWDNDNTAARYAAYADGVRPWRAEIRSRIAASIGERPGARVLELGPGPGLLAQAVLEACPNLTRYTLLDFSAPMLAVSRARLAAYPAASFLQASFKSDDWPSRLDERLDFVVSMQAVHELRHKRHAVRLYRQAFDALAVPGRILICDHTPFDDTPRSLALYMTEAEQQQALADAGFSHVGVELAINGLVLYSGEKSA
jgi:SAM-dependent methyltransferase